MEAVYLKRARSTCYSEIVNFKSYFSEYSQELNCVLEDRKPKTSEIFKLLLGPDSKKDFSKKDLKSLKEELDPKKFKSRTTDVPSPSMISLSSTSRKSFTSNSKADFPLTKLNDCSSVEKDAINVTGDHKNHEFNTEDILDPEKLNTPGRKKQIKRNSKKSVMLPETRVERFSDTTVNSLNSPQTVRCVENSITEVSNGIHYQQHETNLKDVEDVTQLFESALSVFNDESRKSILKTRSSSPNSLKDLHTKGVDVGFETTQETAFVNDYQDLDVINPNILKVNENIEYTKFPDRHCTGQESNNEERRTPLETINKVDAIDWKNMDEWKLNNLNNQEITEITKIPVRWSVRQHIKKIKQEASDLTNCQDIHESNSKILKNRPSTLSLPRLESSENPVQTLRDKMTEINKRSCPSKRKHSIGKSISLDTAKRMGKKDLKPYKHFVISFCIYKPFKSIIGGKGRPAKCVQEVDVLNYQTLVNLRDMIQCEADYQDICGDISDCPDVAHEHLSKDKYKSGMFYFGNTFYVDTSPGTEDYSIGIREWARTRNIHLGETVPMGQMKVEDLEVMLGYPYVYKHQGSCEHLIVIKRARLLHPKDSLHSSDYPNLTRISRTLLVYCGTCTKNPAEFVISGSDRMLNDYNVMCESCFKGFHYVDNKKIGKFKAHRWMQRSLLFP